MKNLILAACLFSGISLKAQVPCFMSISGPTALCPGHTGTLVASGGTTYLWTSTNFTGAVTGPSLVVTPGTFSLIIDGSTNCSTVITVSAAPPLPIVTSVSSSTTCITANYPAMSRTVALYASGAGSYVWTAPASAYMSMTHGSQTAAKLSASGCFTVTGYTSVCSGSAQVCINVRPQFTIAVDPPQSSICNGSQRSLAIINAGVPATGPVTSFSYSWKESSTSLNTHNAQTVYATPAVATTYTAELYDALGCISLPVSATVDVSGCTNLNNQQISRSVIFPSPFSDRLSIGCAPMATITITDACGKAVYTCIAASGELEIGTAGFPAGLYLLSVTAREEQSVTRKLMKH